MNTIFQRTNGTLEMALSNVLQIMSWNAISRHLFFKGGFDLEMEIKITFFYIKQIKKNDAILYRIDRTLKFGFSKAL